MNLKSLVNKSIIKSDLRRFWYLCALFFGGILLLVTIPIIEYAGSDTLSSFLKWDFWSMIDTSLFVILPFGIFIPTIMFSYLHKKSAVCATHSLPLRRECIFFSHIVSSAVLMVVPIIINALIMLSVNVVPSSDILKWAAISIVYCIVLGGISVFSSAIAGNTFAAMAISVVIIILPVCAVSLFEVIAGEYLFGFTYMGGTSLSRVVSKWYLVYKDLLGINSLIYIAIGVVFGISAFICYKKRALENNSSVTAFKVLNPVFMYGVAIFGGLLGALYINEIISVFSIWLAIPFGIIGIIIAKMLILKTFKPQKIVKPSLIYIAIVFVIYAFVGLDITGFEKRVPKLDEIAYVDVSRPSYNDEYIIYENNRIMRAPETKHNTKITDKADIEKVVKLHQNIVDNIAKGQETASEDNKTLPIVYKLKNGRTVLREYSYIPTEEQKKLYYDICEIPTVKAYTYPVLSPAEREYISCYVSTCGYKKQVLTNEQISQLILALREDISNTSSEDMQDETITCIVFDVRFPMIDMDGNRVGADVYLSRTNETYYVRPQYTKTIELLKKWGMYKVMPSVNDIEQILMYNVSEYGEIEDIGTITDRAEVQKYLDYLADTFEIKELNGDGVELEIVYKEDYGWSVCLQEAPNIQ